MCHRVLGGVTYLSPGDVPYRALRRSLTFLLGVVGVDGERAERGREMLAGWGCLLTFVTVLMLRKLSATPKFCCHAPVHEADTCVRNGSGSSVSVIKSNIKPLRANNVSVLS